VDKTTSLLGSALGGNVGVSATQSILDDRHHAILWSFALSNVLLAFDFDGTLAPIDAKPESVAMRSGTRRLLTTAAGLYPCVVISGRRLDDIASRLAGIPVWHVFGNHGLESSAASAHPTAQTRKWVRKLTQDLASHEGVVIEDKGLSVTVHYRGAHDRPKAIEAIEGAVRGLPGARIIGGKEAVNLLPFGGADKGVALRDALRLFACQTAIYVGDDATDEDAFAAAGPHQLLGIHVSPARSSAARYHVESQVEIDMLLEALIDMRMNQQAK
jgi:trehalose 6-phosphate phosphatase